MPMVESKPLDHLKVAAIHAGDFLAGICCHGR